MAGAKTASKNQRASSSSKHAPTVGDFRLITPCNRGRNAYVRNIGSGKNPNVRTDSELFVEAIRAGVEQGHGGKLRAELVALAAAYPEHGWDKALERLEAEQVFAA